MGGRGSGVAFLHFRHRQKMKLAGSRETLVRERETSGSFDSYAGLESRRAANTRLLFPTGPAEWCSGKGRQGGGS